MEGIEFDFDNAKTTTQWKIDTINVIGNEETVTVMVGVAVTIVEMEMNQNRG